MRGDEVELVKAAAQGAVEGFMAPFNELVQQFLGPVANEAGTGLGLVGRYYRVKLAVKMLAKARKMLDEAGIEPQTVPPKLFLPLVESASLEEDEYLQEKWAALLANAANPDTQSAVLPAFPDMLRQLSPADAQLLGRLYHHVCEGIAKQNLPGTALSAPQIELIDLLEQDGDMSVERSVSLENLERLQLLVSRVGILIDGDPNGPQVAMTSFGFQFLQVCQRPHERSSGARV